MGGKMMSCRNSLDVNPGGDWRFPGTLEGIIDALPQHVSVIDELGDIVAVNSAWRRFARCNGDPEEVKTGVGINYLEVCRRAVEQNEEYAQEALSGIISVIRRDQDFFSMEYPCHAPDEQRWFIMSVSPVRGHEHHFVVSHLTITDRRLAEEALQESERLYRSLFNNMLNGFCELRLVYDENEIPYDAVFVEVNEVFGQMFGVSRDNIVGRNSSETLPVIKEKWLEQLGTVAANGANVHFDEYMAAYNKWFSVVMYSPRRGFVIVAFDDITNRKRAEASQRLATVGQLAAGVAHEFNNLLAGMMMRAELSVMREQPESYRELAQLVLRSGKRGADICKSLTAFASPRETKRVPVAVEEVIENVLAVTGRELDSLGVNIETSFASQNHLVVADRGQVEQVIYNLITNASHAMPNGGQLLISTAVHPPRVEGEKAQLFITVTDTGTGIAKEHLSRVFEPFFTTKGRLGDSDVPGTGLGLSLCHGIVTGHGGSINIKSEVGEGTTVTVRLPAQAAVELGVSATSHDTGQWRLSQRVDGGGSHVLVADDDPEVIDGVVEALKAMGHRVTAVGTTAEACTLLESETRFDLVITDVMMPGGGGREILRATLALKEPPPVVVITGRTDQRITDEVLAGGAVAFLSKPFTLTDLAALIEKTLKAN